MHGAWAQLPPMRATTSIYIYMYTYLYIRQAPLATLCMARVVQRHAVGANAYNRTCNGGRVANTAGLPTWNSGSQSCSWQPAQSWCMQACLANRDVDRRACSVRVLLGKKPAIPRLGGAGLKEPESLALVKTCVPSGGRRHAPRPE